jgi:hypothetical protein
LIWPLLIGVIILSFFVSKPVYLTIAGVLAIIALADYVHWFRERHFR